MTGTNYTVIFFTLTNLFVSYQLPSFCLLSTQKLNNPLQIGTYLLMTKCYNQFIGGGIDGEEGFSEK